ncbi:velvet factor-domain-containing protein [Coprinopsis sp. MPI-PUGE-AT-0042]|nr:velvet factor-domain-containing protein [Coprinopsis sp. MPI-PUGE-AT-0042]
MNTPSSSPSRGKARTQRDSLYAQPTGDGGNRRCYPSPPSSRASSGPSSPRYLSGPASPSRLSRGTLASDRRSPTPSVDLSKRHNQSPRRCRIDVASLLSGPEPRTYHLKVIQQPQRTAEFKMGNLSRLPITPTIIVQLVIQDASGNPIVPEAELPFLIAHLSLHSEDGSKSLDMGSQIGKANQATILYGNLVSSLEILEDLQGETGLFLLFPDVSVRWAGRYQLGVTLTRISGSGPTGDLSLAESGTQLGHTRTEAFDVLPHANYTAAPPTPLTQAFIRQGARVNYLA